MRKFAAALLLFLLAPHAWAATSCMVRSGNASYTSGQPNDMTCDTSGNLKVTGSITATAVGSDADNATNSTTKMPVIPCRANAAAPAWTEGHEVPCSTDLAGATRVTGTVTVTDGAGALNVIVDSGTTAVTQPTGTNLHAVLDTTSTTAVTQATASNLNADVNLKTVNAVTVLTGTGAVGTGSQRIAVGTDTATIAGSAPGTAGSASAQVVSVQGVASGTTLPVTVTDASNGTVAPGTAATASKLIGGLYNDSTHQPSATNGQGGAAATDVSLAQRVAPNYTPAANVLVGFLDFNAAGGATTLITIPAGRTWKGTVTLNLSCSKAAAATGNGLGAISINTAGTGVTPSAGSTFAVTAAVGANAATGATGTQGANSGSIPLIVVAPVGNSVTLTATVTSTSLSLINADVTASGELL